MSFDAEEWSMMVDRSCVIEDFGICQGQDSRGLVAGELWSLRCLPLVRVMR